MNRFNSSYNIRLSDIALDYDKGQADNQDAQTRGHHFMARFSEFVPHPVLPYSVTQSGPLSIRGEMAKLYKNPMRSFPYYTLNKGYKEFVLCVVTKGKHFGEQRVLISKIGGSRMFYWDKVPPKFDWQNSYDPKTSPYSPVFYMSPSAEIKSSRLEQNQVPFVFEVSLKSVVDTVSTIASIKLNFNYTSDFIGLDPLTGYRNYRSQGLAVDVDRSYLTKRTGNLQDVLFPEIDARYWRAGIWDMWIETEDALGNKGVAPLYTAHGNDGLSVGIRTIKVNE
jgi:hypothetical protein